MDGEEWVDFSQHESLTTRIHNILDDYPFGVNSLFEFVQNADDAGASRFAFVVEVGKWAERNDKKCLTTNMERWRDAELSLLVYNDAEMTDQDFESIVSLGLSGKRNDATKIGMHGLGFNSVYHFTDVVSFLSRDQMVLFDPHGQCLPDKKLGLRSNFLTHKLMEKYPGQFEGFKGWEEVFPTLDLKQSFQGTMFHLPLRSEALAQESQMSNLHFENLQFLLDVLKTFAEETSTALLFLKNIERVQVMIRDRDLNHVELLHDIFIRNIEEDDLRSKRAMVNRMEADVLLRNDLIIASSLSGDTRWLVVGESNQTLDALKLSKDIGQSTFCSIAVRLNEEGQPVHSNGQAFCFLPLPITTNLPVHINAPFALTQSRRDLVRGEKYGGKHELRGRWNDFLLSQSLASLYGKLLEIFPGNYSLWPRLVGGHAPQSQFESLAIETFKQIASNDLRVFADCAGNHLSFSQVVIGVLRDRLKKTLESFNVFVVDLPLELMESLWKADVETKSVDVAYVTDVLRQNEGELVGGFDRELAEQLMEFVLKTALELNLELLYELDRLPIVPLAGGGLGVFRCPAIDHRIYLLAPSSEMSNVLPGTDILVDPTGISGFAKVCTIEKCLEISNIRPLSPYNLVESKLIDRLIPKSWIDSKVVFFATDHQDIIGIKEDFDLANSSLLRGKQLSVDGPEMKATVTSKRAAKKSAKKATKQARKNKKPAGKTTTLEEADLAATEVTYAFLSKEERGEMERKIDLFWNVLDGSKDFEWEHLKIFNRYPLVRTSSGFVCSLPYARKRKVLFEHSFPKRDEIQLLREFKTWFVGTKSHTLENMICQKRSKLLECIPTQDQEVHSQRSRSILRAQVLQWIKHDEIEIIRQGLTRLPIYECFEKDNYFCLNQNIDGLPVLSTPSDEDGDAFASSSEWEELLKPLFPKNLVNYMEEENLILLRAAHFPRKDSFNFLYEFVVPLLGRGERFSRDVYVKILRELGKLKLWKSITKNMANAREKRLFDAVMNHPVMVFDDGTRKFCRDCVDPDDKLYVKIAGRVNFPPKVYCEDVQILRTLRVPNGLQCLDDGPCFLSAAEIVADRMDVSGGLQLVERLIQSWGVICTRWTRAEIDQVATIPFVPCTALSSMPESPVPFHIIKWLTVESFSNAFRRKRKHQLRGSKQSKASTTQHYLNELGLIESDRISSQLDEMEETEIKIDLLHSRFLHALELIKPFQQNQSSDAYDSVFMPLLVSKSRGANQHVSLAHHALLVFNSSLLFPRCLSKADSSLLERFHINYGVDVLEIARSLSKSAKHWQNASFSWRMAHLDLMKGIVLASCCIIMRHITAERCHVKPVHKQLLLSTLCNSSFVVLDDGSMVLPALCCVDLEESLTDKMHALPTYLLDLKPLFIMIGAPTLHQENAPTVRVNKPPPPPVLESIASVCNDKTLADVVFHVNNGRGGTTCFYGHKLVLSFASPVFRTMFVESHMRESQVGVINIHLEEDDIDAKAMEAMLRYVYTGSCDLLSRPSPEAAGSVLSLLRLSDQYFLEHLKQSCEVYLCDPDNGVVDIYNCCDLLQHADFCNAFQLKAVCLYHIRETFQVVSQMPEYHRLPDDLKNQVLITKK